VVDRQALAERLAQIVEDTSGRRPGILRADVDALCADAGLNPDFLLKPGEVAQLFRVDPRTVTRWASQGRMQGITTPGGHGRCLVRVVVRLMLRLGEDPTVAVRLVAQFVRAIT